MTSCIPLRTQTHYDLVKPFKRVIKVEDIASKTQPRTKLPYPVEVKPSSIKGAGNGVFATRDIKSGEIVAFYDGICCYPSNWCSKWEETCYNMGRPCPNSIHIYLSFVCGRSCYTQNYPDHYIAGYAFEFNQGGVAQLINDATDIYDRSWGTQVFKKYNVGSHGNTPYMKATKDIKKGEELFHAYGVSYWNDIHSGVVYPDPRAYWKGWKDVFPHEKCFGGKTKDEYYRRANLFVGEWNTKLALRCGLVC